MFNKQINKFTTLFIFFLFMLIANPTPWWRVKRETHLVGSAFTQVPIVDAYHQVVHDLDTMGILE